MIRYKHTQSGWWVILLLLLVGAVFIALAIQNKYDVQAKRILLLPAFIIFLCLLIFNSLTTVIKEDHVKVYFGSGLVSKKILLERISECRVVKNSFIMGWGIRIWPGFILWNISGLGAVELTFKDKKWKFRIGTDQPEKLFEEITSALKERQLSAKEG